MSLQSNLYFILPRILLILTTKFRIYNNELYKMHLQ